MKRILCIIESLGSGGAERQITGLAVMLKQAGYQVEVLYYVNKDFYLSYLHEHGVAARYLADASNPRKRFFALKNYINEYAPDTVISYSVSSNMICCLLKLFGAKFNLIPFNPWPGCDYKPSSNNRVHTFSRALEAAGYEAPIRVARGQDILAACGQLKSKKA